MKLHLCVGIVFSCLSASLYASELAGKVDFIDGEVTVIQDNGNKHLLKVGDVISKGDTLVSAKNSEAHLHMKDEAYLALRANSRVVIKSYQAQNKATDNSSLQLLKGSLRIVTGWIGQLHPKNYQVNTPTGTIGVRGTDHEPLYIAPEDATDEQPAGTYDHVVEGETFIANNEGEVAVTVDNVGFMPFLGKPHLLSKLPNFFPKGQFDNRIRDIKPLLKQHIQEKIQQIQQDIQQHLHNIDKKREALQENINHRHLLPLPNLPRP